MQKRSFKKHFIYFAFFIIAFFPFIDYLIRKYKIPLSNTWDDLFILLLLLVSLIYGSKKIRNLLNNQTFVFALLFFSTTLISFYLNNYSVYVYINESRILLEPFIAFSALILLEPEKNEIHMFLKFLIISGCLLSLHGIYQYITKVPTPPEWVDKDLEAGVISTRAFSVLRGPNVLGDYLELILPLPLIYILKSKRREHKVFWTIPFIVIGCGLIVTLSRTAWIASTFALFIGTLWVSPLLGLVFIFAASALLIIVKPVRIRILSLFSKIYLQKSMSSGGRIYQWTSGIIDASEHPLLGTGLGTFGGVVSYSYGFVARRSIDSAYIKILSETGWIGLTFFILWVSWGAGTNLARYVYEKNIVSLFVGAGLIAFILNLFTQNIFIAMGQGTIIFWTLSAVGSIYNE